MSHFTLVNRLIIMEDEDSLKEFEKYKNLLISISYRMLGSFSEAEDNVQEVAIEWLKVERSRIKTPKAWLLKVTTNKALDALKRAYKKREIYIGTWLPEVLPDSLITWDDEILKKESIQTSFLILLESLSPRERAVFILREIVESSFKEIANFVDLTDVNCRKIYERAKEKLKKREVTCDKYDKNSLDRISDFFEASVKGESNKIEKILAPNSEFWSDGGGKVSAVKVVMRDIKKISIFFSRVFSLPSEETSKYRHEFTFVNHLPGMVISRSGLNGLWEIETIFSFEIKNGKIFRIYGQRNPEKLSFLTNIK